jgi:predicted porin
MKKSLLALAALSAFATAAQAQSSVTIYGIADVSWISTDNDAGQTAGTLGSATLATSRLGFKGTEDLGGGLKAGFVLESQLDFGQGSTGTTQDSTTAAATTFNRGAFVSLSSATLGEIRLGKQDVTYANDIDTGVSQMGNLGNFGTASAAGELGKDKDNAVVYVSPTFSGFQLQAGYATMNTATAEATTGDTTSYMVSYAKGPLKLFAAQQEEKAIAAADNKEEMILGASYDAGFASFGIAYQDGEAGTAKNKQTNYTVAVPVKALGSGVKVHAGYLINENETTANSDITTTRLAETKALSKRTTVYVAYSSADNDSAVATVGGKTVVQTAVGMLHTF